LPQHLRGWVGGSSSGMWYCCCCCCCPLLFAPLLSKKGCPPAPWSLLMEESLLLPPAPAPVDRSNDGCLTSQTLGVDRGRLRLFRRVGTGQWGGAQPSLSSRAVVIVTSCCLVCVLLLRVCFMVCLFGLWVWVAAVLPSAAVIGLGRGRGLLPRLLPARLAVCVLFCPVCCCPSAALPTHSVPSMRLLGGRWRWRRGGGGRQ
jgi:hypothetical protein